MEKTMKPFNLNVKKCFYMFVDHDDHIVLLVAKNSMTSTLADAHCWDSRLNDSAVLWKVQFAKITSTKSLVGCAGKQGRN